ncbi:FMRFamide peptide receptor frpr-18-like [Ruditapes philippinarum]|uniref:FMRFamide peptide receptor frpr-18-like n=1 Tax=Ruditapes philippinarum TaxID=129788 RepID=UPI00295AF8A4|nr:FMRFamide peptide receptor frpr-18-like [Ruditapes philippinarum]
MACWNASNESCTDGANISNYNDMEGPFISEWGFWVKFISTPIVVFVGVIGNSLSIMVMKTKPLRQKSYSHFLCALAVFDTISLIIRQVECVDEYFVSHKAKPGIFQNFDDSSCKFYNYMSHVITMMSSWLVVFMALERLIAVCFPFKSAAIRKQTGALTAIAILIVVVLFSQSFRFIMIEHLVYDPYFNISDCLAGDDYIRLYTSLDVYFFQWGLIFVIPLILIITCNSMVIYQIFKVKKAVNKDERSLTRRESGGRGRNNRSTMMLLTVTFTYILTLLPLFTLSLVMDLTIKFGNMETKRYVYLALTPYIDVCAAISLLNYAVNFFIYVLSGKRFRFEFERLIRKRNTSIKRTFTARSTREELFRM